jgi:hypothetical protein
LRAPPAPRYGLVGHELAIAKPVIPIEQQFAAHGTDGEVFTERDMRRLLAAGQVTTPCAFATPAAGVGGAGHCHRDDVERWVEAVDGFALAVLGSRCVRGRARSGSPAAGARSPL